MHFYLILNKYSLTTNVPNKKYTKSSSFQCMIMMKINFFIDLLFYSGILLFVWGLLCTAQIMLIKSIQQRQQTHIYQYITENERTDIIVCITKLCFSFGP